MKEYSSIERKTKEIYIEQHKNYLKDSSIFKRHLESAQHLDTYDVPAEFFKGKTILDAGCGNSGYFQVAMYNLGAKHVTCLDIGEDWKPELAKILSQHNIPLDFCDYVSGSTIDLPFANENFDFVASNGVIMHLETVEMAELAVNELSRVARTGGDVYCHIGIDSPGIVDKYIVKALRLAYEEDEEFKRFVDLLNPERLKDEIISMFKSCAAYDPRLHEVPDGFVSSLFTLDTITFWRNMLQVPVQQGPLLSEDWGRSTMSNSGLINIRRPKGTYWVRNDFRRFLAPIHYSLSNPIARLFYGNGHVKLIAEKA